MIARKALVIAVVVALITAGVASDAFCDDPLKKLGRGIANVFTCWLEVTYQVHKATDADGPWSGVTVGVIKGVSMTFVRAAVGVYETATFLMPFPRDYGPMLKDPEFFWEEDVY